jgi:hypothetical protein
MMRSRFLTVVLCAGIALGAAACGGGGGGGGGGVVNTEANINNLAFLNHVSTGNTRFQYDLSDADADICNVTFQFSTDGGTTWFAATSASGGYPTSGLASSPGTGEVGMRFIPQIRALPMRITRCALIPTDGLGMQDDHHFDMAGQKDWSDRAMQILVDRAWAPWPR